MKGLIRGFFLSGLVLYLSVLIYPGMIYDGRLETLIIAAIALMLLNRIVKPLIKLFLLPINLITLGLFRWVAHVLTLFLLTRIVSGFGVVGFVFTGWESNGFVIPVFEVSTLMSYVLGSITIGVIASSISWILED